MNFLTDILLFAPHPYGLILLSILVGFCGWFIPFLILSWYNYKNPQLAVLSGLFCLLLVAQFGEDVIIGKKRAYFIDQQVESLREDKIFDAMFTHIPDSVNTLKNLLHTRYQKLHSSHEDELRQQLAYIRHEVLQAHFAEFLSRTSNKDLYNFLKLSYPQMYALKKTPKLCVRYFLGVPDKAFTLQNEEWMDREEAIKYAMIVKALRTPDFKEPQTREQVIFGLVTAYREIKWDEAELEKSDSLLSIDPKEACDISLHMLEAFLHMEQDKGARAYRFIMLDGNKYYRQFKQE